jgi:hypothetical protein
MKQTRKQSLAETITGTLIGYIVAVAANALVLPLFGYKTTVGDNLGIAIIFTVISLVRGYYVCRLFNWWHHR